MWKDNNQKQKPGFMPYENEDELEDYFEKKYKSNHQKDFESDLDDQEIIAQDGSFFSF